MTLNDDEHPAVEPSRRDFGKSLTALAALPLSGAEPLPPAAELVDRTGRRTQAQALMQIVRLRYGKFLTDDQLKQLERRLGNAVRGSEALKRFKLQNGDEPGTVFRADIS
jgi:hypothetical protein